MADIVVGSGPSGIAVASALLARGREVLMIDGGKVLEPAREAARQALSARPPADWSDSDRANWQAPQFAARPGQTRRYGSDFAMEPAAATYADGSAAFALRASHAVGGLSNLWGSAVLPYRAADLAGWPVSAEDMAPHYRAIAGFLPIAGTSDDLQTLFPDIPMAGRTALPASPQGAHLMERLSRAKPRLAKNGLTAGQSRQAVAPGCRGCGQCLHGCPWGLIWSAGQRLTELRQIPGFTYRPGAPVLSFSEEAHCVTLHLAGGESLTAARVFLATGVLETARLWLAAQPGAARLTLRDSQHAFLPLLHLWQVPQAAAGQLTTLTQAFLELDAPDLSPWAIHAQLYGWNEYYQRDLMAAYGRRLPGSGPLWRALARRMIVAQIFLHSDHSGHADLTLAADGRLSAAIHAHPDTARLMGAAAARMGKGLRGAGLMALRPALRVNPVGSSFHVGASLPMAKSPKGAQSDLLGRPAGLSRLHVVDASALPTIPATTITLPVMANAHRIGMLAP